MKFYTLLYINKSNDLSNSILTKNLSVKIEMYAKCCKTLLNSLDGNLIVITNDAKYLEKYLPKQCLIEIAFTLQVPSDIGFYSAHYKLDVFKWFSENIKEYSILIDSDIICNKPIDVPLSLQYCIDNNIPTYYDISDQVHPADGSKKIIDDKTLVMKKASIGLWAGGEYIGGDSLFFKKLSKYVDSFLDSYFDNWQVLHHNGDEFPVSCAIEQMLLDGIYIAEAGCFDVICRYWNAGTRHVQNLLASHKNTFLLHLPLDKTYLSNLSDKDNSNFFVKYSEAIKEVQNRNKLIDNIAWWLPSSKLRVKIKDKFKFEPYQKLSL